MRDPRHPLAARDPTAESLADSYYASHFGDLETKLTTATATATATTPAPAPPPPPAAASGDFLF